jgi:hypothetical protein
MSFILSQLIECEWAIPTLSTVDHGSGNYGSQTQGLWDNDLCCEQATHSQTCPAVAIVDVRGSNAAQIPSFTDLGGSYTIANRMEGMCD